MAFSQRIQHCVSRAFQADQWPLAVHFLCWMETCGLRPDDISSLVELVALLQSALLRIDAPELIVIQKLHGIFTNIYLQHGPNEGVYMPYMECLNNNSQFIIQIWMSGKHVSRILKMHPKPSLLVASYLFWHSAQKCFEIDLAPNKHDIPWHQCHIYLPDTGK